MLPENLYTGLTVSQREGWWESDEPSCSLDVEPRHVVMEL
jgi:hypothetical protein